VVAADCVATSKQGDHFSGKPGKVSEFRSCQGNVRELAFHQGIVGNVREKNLVRENCYNVCMVWVTDTGCDMTLTVYSW